ncbi:NACHT domain-containing protein [Colletotrichum tofieldiae]|nr:NACHT domain-containing protein [Colletotrichum tofieldiae]
MANIVDDLNLAAEEQKVAVAYFFCRHDIPQSLESRTVIGSLARQILDKCQTVSDRGGKPEEKDLPVELGLDELVEFLLRQNFTGIRPAFVVDGLDECTKRERSVVCSTLGRLQNAFCLLVCVSTRLDAGKALDQDIQQLMERNTITMPRHNLEMDEFINAKLEECLSSGTLVIGDPTIIVDIRETLLEEAEGMFLWVALQIDSLYRSRQRFSNSSQWLAVLSQWKS